MTSNIPFNRAYWKKIIMYLQSLKTCNIVGIVGSLGWSFMINHLSSKLMYIIIKFVVVITFLNWKCFLYLRFSLTGYLRHRTHLPRPKPFKVGTFFRWWQQYFPKMFLDVSYHYFDYNNPYLHALNFLCLDIIIKYENQKILNLKKIQKP